MIYSALTLNIQNAQLWDEENPEACDICIQDTIAFLLAQDADVIFLQEVECGHDGGLQVEPPPHFTELRRRLNGYDGIFAYPPQNELEIPFGLGLAIFSKTKLRDRSEVILPASQITFEYGGLSRRPSERLLLTASTVWEGVRVNLANTHLQAYFVLGTTSDVHRDQRNLVEAEMKKLHGPSILAGDFNAPGEGLVEQFHTAGFQSAQIEETTWRREPFVLDHIFYNQALILHSHVVIPTTSDHHAVRAEFVFSGRAKK